jgi:hypothetical protein
MVKQQQQQQQQRRRTAPRMVGLKRSPTFYQLPDGTVLGGQGQGRRQFNAAIGKSMLPGRVRLTALHLDPVLQALNDLKGMFKKSAVEPVRKQRVPSNGAKFVIYFDDNFLTEYGNVMVKINEKGWPLGHPLSTELASSFSHPEQKKLRRQRQTLLRMLREETTGTGSLLEPRASKVATYSIWEAGHGGMRCFEWVNGFE